MHFFSWRTTTNDENNNGIDDNGVDDTTTTTTSDALYVVPLTMTCMYLGMMLSSSVLQKMLGLRTCMIVGGVMMSGGVLMASFATRLESRLSFGVVTTLILWCYGGNYAMAPGACAALFHGESGRGHDVFAYLFSAFAAAGIVGSMMMESLLVAGYGFETVFIGMAVLSVCAGILVQGLGRI